MNKKILLIPLLIAQITALSSNETDNDNQMVSGKKTIAKVSANLIAAGSLVVSGTIPRLRYGQLLENIAKITNTPRSPHTLKMRLPAYAAISASCYYGALVQGFNGLWNSIRFLEPNDITPNCSRTLANKWSEPVYTDWLTQKTALKETYASATCRVSTAAASAIAATMLTQQAYKRADAMYKEYDNFKRAKSCSCGKLRTQNSKFLMRNIRTGISGTLGLGLIYGAGVIGRDALPILEEEHYRKF